MKVTLIVEVETASDKPSEVRDRVRNALDDAFDNNEEFASDVLASVREV